MKEIKMVDSCNCSHEQLLPGFYCCYSSLEEEICIGINAYMEPQEIPSPLRKERSWMDIFAVSFVVDIELRGDA